MKTNIAALPVNRSGAAGPLPAGTVLAPLTDGLWLVATHHASVSCRRAFSCLIDPQPGDRVAICESGGETFVLAVLERAIENSVTHLRVEGDLLLEATHDLQMRAGRELSSSAQQTLRLDTQELHVGTRTAHLTGEDVEMHAGEARLHTGLMRVVANVLESVAKRITQVSRTTYRSVETVDHLRAAHVDHAASASMRLHGSTMVLTAEQLTKVDAEQIHLG
ncbi:hypothetical protein LMG28688_04920 [Paraburkholderia caffeinitolerans]|uniref:DUF3540 domain-containing protein n=2 Tax=Burkholderiaceae TaxID=119060 RepID=A0A6J5GEM2_9BURK|nr:hypothetical protein LMG28688_04920 [Paraburkholderia caffeinitolerans]